MAKFEQKLLATKMRRQGASIAEIAVTLGVSKSTASLWCRDLKLTQQQQKILLKRQIEAGNVGRMRGAQINRERKEKKIQAALQAGKQELSQLSAREFLIAGLALYWGEGSKGDKLSIVNSDPQMVVFMIKWLNVFFGVQTIDLILRVHINEVHRSREPEVVDFWAKTLGVPAGQFRPTSFNKSVSKKVYENYTYHYGLVSIRVHRSTDLKYRILGLIDGLKNSNLPISPM